MQMVYFILFAMVILHYILVLIIIVVWLLDSSILFVDFSTFNRVWQI